MARPVQTNLSAGEISKQAAARFDLAMRGAAAEALENVYVMIEGGVTRAGGGIHVAAPKHHDKRARLIPFKKSNEDVVIIEAGENYFRYHNAFMRAPLLDGSSNVIETATSYDAASIPGIYSFQSADVMFFTVKTGLKKPAILIRYDDDDWQLSDYEAKEGPFLPQDQNNITLTPSAATGSITISSSPSGVFSADQVGCRFRLWTNNQGVPYAAWKPEEQSLTIGMRRVHQGRVYRVTFAGDGTNSPPIHEKGAVKDGGAVEWTFEQDLAGVVKVTGFNSASSVDADVESQLPEGLSTNTWAEGFFSDKRGWPFVGGLFQSRLWYFGSRSFPDTAWGTRIDGYGLVYADFKQSAGGGEVLDDHAVVRTLNDGEVNRIAWAVMGEQVLIGHAGGIVRISGPSLQEPITPAGASATKPEPPPGTYFWSRAIKAGDRVVYASTSGRRIIALNPQDFSFRTLTALARDKGAKRFIDFAYASEPYNRLFALREDGRLFACAFDQEQGVIGWSTIIPAGSLNGDIPTIDAICVAPGVAGRDRLWWIVARTINGQLRRAIEVCDVDFEANERLADQAIFADGAVSLDNWNSDTAKKVTITHASGAAAALRDASVTLTPSSFSFAAGDVGKEIRLRRIHAPRRASDVDGEIAALITAQTAGVATATLLTDVPAALYGVPLDQWALCSSTISGLSHLEAESVGVWADGVDLGDFTVASGAIALGENVARAHAGLRRPWRVLSLPFVLALRDGVSKGQVLQAKRAYLEILDTAAEAIDVDMLVGGRAVGRENLGGRTDDDLMSNAMGLRSGDFRVPLVAGKSRKLQLMLSGAGMGPASILSIGLEYEP